MRTRDGIMVWAAVALFCYTAYRIAWHIIAFWWRGNPSSLVMAAAMGIIFITAGAHEKRKEEDN